MTMSNSTIRSNDESHWEAIRSEQVFQCIALRGQYVRVFSRFLARIGSTSYFGTGRPI